MNSQFDELAKSMAPSDTRRGALKKLGVGLAGQALVAAAFVLMAEAGPQVPPAQTNPSIRWSEIGAKATADCRGDGLIVIATETGAQLHCEFQRLAGEATTEGLWLSSTVTHQAQDRFRVAAAAIGSNRLPQTGNVTVTEKLVRYSRPGLVEEYSVSVDGVRQDFVVESRPAGDGPLQVELSVTGARLEPLVNGVRLVLEHSGRKIAYDRLRVTDATGKELPASIKVLPAGDEVAGLKSRNQELEMSQSLLTSLPAVTAFAVVVNDAEAVYPVRIDPTFSDANWVSMGGIPGANGRVFATVMDGSGNLYIGGEFNVVGDVFANGIAKWDGSRWTALGSGMEDGFVYALASSGSDVYAGGRFTTVGGATVNYVAKWNGTNWSALGSGTDGLVSALLVWGNDLYVGGYFTMAGGTAANCIAKWNGSSWSALGSGMDEVVYALAVSGGNLYAGGGFENADGSPAKYIAKWNGSSWSALGLGVDNDVHALAVLGGDLFAGGTFKTAGGVEAVRIAKWNGSNWSALGSGMDGIVFALLVSGGDLYAGGLFGTADDSTVNFLAKWNGSSWSALGSGLNDEVHSLAGSGSSLYAGGYFWTAGGKVANGVAKWNGTSWSALASGMGGGIRYYAVSALAVSGSEVYVGGDFMGVGGVAAANIAKWNGTSWSALGPGLDDAVNALAVSGSNVYAGGFFTMAGSVSVNHIAKWNGNSWSALGSGISTDDPRNVVIALAVSGSDVYAGGFFTNAGGIAVNHTAKWNGTNWSALGSGMSGGDYIPTTAVYALAVSDSDVYAGGQFWTAGGIAATNIAKWNGSGWSALGSGISYRGAVTALAVSGSDVYAGGAFEMAGGGAATNIAKWNGNSWSALGSGTDYPVYALAVSGSEVYAGGAFRMADGSPANYIAKWNGTSWSALGSGMDNHVYALAVSGNDLFVGGIFTVVGGKVSAYIARAYMPTLPTLSIRRSSIPQGGVTVSWPSADTAGFALEQAGTLAAPLSWVTNSASVADDGTNKSVLLSATNSAQFFRLRRP